MTGVRLRRAQYLQPPATSGSVAVPLATLVLSPQIPSVDTGPRTIITIVVPGDFDLADLVVSVAPA